MPAFGDGRRGKFHPLGFQDCMSSGKQLWHKHRGNEMFRQSAVSWIFTFAMSLGVALPKTQGADHGHCNGSSGMGTHFQQALKPSNLRSEKFRRKTGAIGQIASGRVYLEILQDLYRRSIRLDLGTVGHGPCSSWR